MLLPLGFSSPAPHTIPGIVIEFRIFGNHKSMPRKRQRTSYTLEELRASPLVTAKKMFDEEQDKKSVVDVQRADLTLPASSQRTRVGTVILGLTDHQIDFLTSPRRYRAGRLMRKGARGERRADGVMWRTNTGLTMSARILPRRLSVEVLAGNVMQRGSFLGVQNRRPGV